ncbi:MAG: 3,4-dihydroxy-2-butanone-4-phosphate synthase [Alphaproteobacteria bacterium]|nr:3,4-dihydroxy-2-butanone-4-phosphate synthase [Alphaproteobacteria bacterium]TAD91257.1 MAG: 3,4-dihydroxy-2-butanone-4-phosphate synthase [Alphaproteobacteria bacterium]
MHDTLALSSIEDLLADLKAGRPVILADDEDRENEGDIVLPADLASPEQINFMARYARGLICLAMTRQRVASLGLPLMAQHNGTRHQTAFTVSIEAREGVSTGISAADRSHTILTAIDPAKGRDDIVTPGHVFPLVARDGGVLERAGHTEAAVDLARLAGFKPAGVICEIMNDDGTMARLPDLIAFAQRHGLKVGTIADLIKFRRQRERLIQRNLTTHFETAHAGGWQLTVYANTITGVEHLALVKGDLSQPGPVLVRMHALSVLDDVLGDRMQGRAGELHHAMQRIDAEGRGVVVLLRDPLPTSVSDRLTARLEGRPFESAELRDYGIGAQILLDLGVREMILLSNSQRTVVGLDGYDLTILGRRPIT